MKKQKSNLKEKDAKITKKIAFKDLQKETSNKLNKKTEKHKRQKPRNINSNKEIKIPEFPESIADSIINKIISFVVYQNTVKEVYSHIDEKCFNYLKYLISPYISSEYMIYEDGIEDINHQKTKMFYKIPAPKKVNSWVIINEPVTPQIDRHASSSTKILSFKTDANDKDNAINNANKDVINQNIKDLKNIRRKSTTIDANLIVNESVEYSKRTKSIRDSSIKNVSYKEKNNNSKNKKNIKNIENNEILEKRRQKLLEKLKKEEEQKILELTWVDLPKEKYENKYIMDNDNDENNVLRKERETLIIKQTELKALKEIQDKKEKLKRFQSRLQKNFDGSRQTFDPNGNIINIRPPQVENLIKEFCIIKIPNIESKNTLKDRRKSSFLMKNESLLKRKSFLDKNKSNLILGNKLKKFNKIKLNDRLSEEEKEIFKYIRNILLPKWQHKPVKKEFYEDEGNEEEKEEEKTKKRFLTKKSFKEFFGLFLQKYIFKEEVEHNPIDLINNNMGYYKYDNAKRKIILPSGPNFKKIQPEVGVVIENKNNEKRKEIKDGGFEFIKKYNKPSMYEFSKLLMETSHLNSTKILSSGLIESKINEINEINNLNRISEINKEEYNYNGYMVEFSDNNNPLIQGAFSPNDKQRIFSSLSKNKNLSEIEKENKFEKINILKSKNLLKSLDEKYIRNKYNSVNSINMQNSNIQLTNNIKAPNLYSYFHESIKEPEKKLESNNDENYEDNDFNRDFYNLERERNKERNSALPIIRIRKNELNKNHLNELKNQIKGRKIINKFNYKIIKNKKWGEEDEKKKKEREMLNYGYENGNSNNNPVDSNNKRIQLKKVGESIIDINNDGKYTIRSRKPKLFRSSSAGNFFY